MLESITKDISLRYNLYKIVVPLFGAAAYAAPNIGTTILY